MADNTNEFNATMEDDLAILPDGWGEGDDIFNVDSWGKDASADESEGSNGQQDQNKSIPIASGLFPLHVPDAIDGVS